MKVINTVNGKVLANIVTNHSMTVEEALELVGIDLSQCDENEGFYLDQDGEQFWIENLVSGEDIEIPFEIKSVEWDNDLGGLIVEVEFWGKTHQFMQQYMLDDDGDIAGTDGNCWSWIDGDNIEGEHNGSTIVDKLPMFKDIENPARGEEKAWDFFEEVMNEAKEVYNDNKNKVINEWGREFDFGATESLMDNEIRERLHYELAPCTNQEFFDAYAKAHAEKFGEEWELSKSNPCW